MSIIERYNLACLERDIAIRAAWDANNLALDAKDYLRRLEHVEKFFNVLADERRAQLEDRVEALVDQGLKFVFGMKYSFVIRSELTGKQVRTKFYVLEEGLELNILDAAGGGIADTVAFLLRVVMLVLRKPPQRRVLILDESLKFLSAEYISKMAEFIPELARSLDLQIILTTHRQELIEAASTVIKVTKTGKESQALVSD